MTDQAAPSASPAAAPTRKRSYTGLAFWLAVFTFVVQGSIQGTNSVLLPNQVTLVDPANKVANLAIVTSVAFAVALIVQPIVGLLSDRTRGPLGRRAPWMLGGAAGALLALVFIGRLDSLPALAAAWALVQVSYNVMLAPASAILPDRVPVQRRGTVSAFVGFGTLVGAGAATFIAGSLARDLPAGYTAFGIAIVAAAILLILFQRDKTMPPAERPAFRLRSLLTAFWVNPRKHPDFAWAFAARFLFVIAYSAVVTFQLYLLTDYVGMSLPDANARIGVLGVATVIGAVIAMFVGGPLSDRLQRRKPFLYAASAIMASGLIAPLISPTFPALIVLALLFGTGFGLYMVCDGVLMTQVLPNPEGDAAKDLGVLNLANAIPAAVAPALGGLLVTLTGGYDGLFIAGILLVALAAVALWPIRAVR